MPNPQETLADYRLVDLYIFAPRSLSFVWFFHFFLARKDYGMFRKRWSLTSDFPRENKKLAFPNMMDLAWRKEKKESSIISSRSRLLAHRPCPKLEMFWPSVLFFLQKQKHHIDTGIEKHWSLLRTFEINLNKIYPRDQFFFLNRLHNIFFWTDYIKTQNLNEVYNRKLTVIPLPSSLVRLEKLESIILTQPTSFSIRTALRWGVNFPWFSQGALPWRAAPLKIHSEILMELSNSGLSASWMSIANGTWLGKWFDRN